MPDLPVTLSPLPYERLLEERPLRGRASFAGGAQRRRLGTGET